MNRSYLIRDLLSGNYGNCFLIFHSVGEYGLYIYCLCSFSSLSHAFRIVQKLYESCDGIPWVCGPVPTHNCHRFKRKGRYLPEGRLVSIFHILFTDNLLLILKQI